MKTNARDKTSHMTDEEWEEWKEAYLEEHHTYYLYELKCPSCGYLHFKPVEGGTIQGPYGDDLCVQCGHTLPEEGPILKGRDAISITRGPSAVPFDPNMKI